MSPMSFFFGPLPKLLLRDQEKKMPRFLSALSSLLSSFSDLPDLCFLPSCWSDNKKQRFHLLSTTSYHRDKCFISSQKQQWHLFRSGKCRAVRAGAVFRGRRTAGNLVGVRQGSAIHLSAHAFLVKGGLEESWIAVKLHQVEDLWTWRKIVVFVSEGDGDETCRVKIKGVRGIKNETQTVTREQRLLLLTYGYSLCYDRCLNSWLFVMYRLKIYKSDCMSICQCVQFALDSLWVYASLCLSLW